MPGLAFLDFTGTGGQGPPGPSGPGVLNWLGEYDNDTTYEPNDAVSYQGSSYICLLETTGNLPTDDTYWNLLAQKGDQGAQGEQGPAGQDGLDIAWRGPYDNGTQYFVNDAVQYQGSSYICTANSLGNLPTDMGFWDLMAQKGGQGDQGVQGNAGDQGAHGGAVTIRYTISDQTDDADPGDGILRLNNFSPQNAATAIRVDHLDVGGTDWSSVLVTLDDSTSAIKGHIRLVDPTDQSKWLLFTVSAVGSEAGYKNVSVTNVGSSAASPFSNGDPVLLTFTRQGDKGDIGATGAAGVDGLDITWRGAYDNGTMYAINDAVEYQGSSYIATGPTIGNPPTDSNFWDLMAQKGDTGNTGATGAGGNDGPAGGAITIQYEFDDSTGDADPGSGKLRLSHAAQNASTAIRVDHEDINAVDWSSILTTLDDNSSAVKGHIRLFNADDESRWLVFTVSAVGSETGYKNISVTNVGFSQASPFLNADRVVLAFTRTGDKGETGSQGDQGEQGPPGQDGLDITWRGAYDDGTMYAINDAVLYQGSSYIAKAPTIANPPTDANFWDLMAEKGDRGGFGGAIAIEYLFDETTADGDPGDGRLRLNQTAQNASTVIRADLLDASGDDWTATLDTLDDSTSSVKGFIRIVHREDLTKWIEFSVAALASQTGHRNITVAALSSSETSPFVNNDPVVLFFTRNGDKGDTGDTGATGATGDAGPHGGAVAIYYTFSDVTADSDPGAGNLRLNQATQNTSTVIRVDLLDRNNDDWGTVILGFANELTGDTGFIRLVKEDDLTKWLLFSIDQVNPETGYYNLFGTVVASSETNPFAASDSVVLHFSKNGRDGDDGMEGPPGEDGNDGQHGGAVTVQYTFSTTTTDSDPGDGNLRLNQLNQNAATMIRADLLDSAGADWTAVLDTFDDSSSTIKGHIRLVKANDFTSWLLFSVSALASPTGYKNITVTNVASSATSPFADGDPVLLTFIRNGDKGDTGNTGATGAAGPHGGGVAINYTFSTTTTDADPGNGNLRLDNATQSDATTIRADLLDSNGTDWTAVLDYLADPFPPPLGIEPLTGNIRLVHRTDLSKWIVFQVDNVVAETGYRNLLVSVIDSSATNPFSNGDPTVLHHTRNGRDGSDGLPGQDGTATPVDIQVFTSSSTWTRPEGAQSVCVTLIGGGGGGGSGRKGGSGNNRAGGAGGGGGGYTQQTFQASFLGGTETVTVGSGGTGGAPQTASSTDGNQGGTGGSTTFGSHLAAHGGQGGVAGDAGSTENPGAFGGAGEHVGAQGGSANNTAGGNGNNATSFAGAGGGGGGGTGGTAANIGGSGGIGSWYVLNGGLSGGSGGTTTPTNGGNGTSVSTGRALGGGGGGGGGFNNAGPATTGGAGGNYGGGGGGGSAGRDNLFDSGAGGNGAPGVAIVITYF